MLNNLKPQPEDKILGLAKLYRADERPHKIDLGVGVYKDQDGRTPVMRAIKAAEQKLWEKEDTKTYTSLTGDAGFHEVMADLVLGDSVARDRLSFAATPGGTGAVHQILELVQLTGGSPTIWVSDPTWPNHLSILKHLKMPTRMYRYFDSASGAVSFDDMMADLEAAAEGDVVLLHGCCHNPTGANLNHSQWQAVTDLILRKNLTPFVDIAYQGFGDGLEEDAYGVRLLASKAPELVIAASCSKNFGIYRERTGLVIAVSANAADQPVTQANLAYVNRQNFSFPPDHGARLVTMVLSDPALRADWQAELEQVRGGMLDTRTKLAEALQQASGSNRFGFLAEHRGMFSRLGATPEQVAKLREDHAIYMIGDSRMNIAGITEKSIPILAKAFIEVGV